MLNLPVQDQSCVNRNVVAQVNQLCWTEHEALQCRAQLHVSSAIWQCQARCDAQYIYLKRHGCMLAGVC